MSGIVNDRLIVVGAGGFLGHRVCAMATARPVLGVCRRRPERDVSGAAIEIADRLDPAVVTDILAGTPAAWIDTAINDELDARALIKGAAAARDRGCALPRFVITSTVGEYGPSLAAGGEISEASIIGADDPHAEGKLRAFDVLMREADWMSVTWAVLPMLWGPGDHDGSGPGGKTRPLIQGLRRTGRVSFEGTCDNLLPDGFSDTIAQALVFAALETPRPGVSRLLVAGPENLTPRGFVDEAAAALGITVEVKVTSPGKNDGPDRGSHENRPPRAFPGNSVRMDCSRLYGAGFKPSFDWRTGVRLTVAAVLAESGARTR